MELASANGLVGFSSSITEDADTVVIRLDLDADPGGNNKVCFWGKSFYLKVLLIEEKFQINDTALFRVDINHNPVTVEYSERSDLLQMRAVLELPDNLQYLQFVGKSQNEVRRFLEQLDRSVGNAVE
jgi:hypothetical protein